MTYIKRDIEKELNLWKSDSNRQPIVLRGARQVGKSFLVRQFGKSFHNFVEVNFESEPEVASIFASTLDPKTICEQLSIVYNQPIIPQETLLFLDEIQNCLPAISSLRFFYEKYPQLHVIAAGSLLEFALAELPSFGVGRVVSMYLHPLSFGEFLNAANEEKLRKAIYDASPQNPLAPAIHTKALSLYKKFTILGGMPKVVATYFDGEDLLRCQRLLDTLTEGFEDDFVKYSKKTNSPILRSTLRSVAAQNGNKFILNKAMPDTSHFLIKQSLDLLVMAGLVIPVILSSGNGIPLGAETNPKFCKYLIADAGIFHRLLDLNLSEIILSDDFQSINKGAIAELSVGLELIKASSCFRRNTLYYWHREERSSNAEIDYLIQKGNEIIPIEVKSGTKGAMQSMNLFLSAKNLSKGIRVSQENFGTYGNIDVYPLYAVPNILK